MITPAQALQIKVTGVEQLEERVDTAIEHAASTDTWPAQAYIGDMPIRTGEVVQTKYAEAGWAVQLVRSPDGAFLRLQRPETP